MDQRSPGGDLLLPRLPGPVNIPAKFAPSTRSVVVVSSFESSLAVSYDRRFPANLNPVEKRALINRGVGMPSLVLNLLILIFFCSSKSYQS